MVLPFNQTSPILRLDQTVATMLQGGLSMIAQGLFRYQPMNTMRQ